MSSHARFEPETADQEIPASRLAIELSDYLASAAQQLKLVIDASLDVVTLVNERGELLFVSAAVTGLTGFTPEEVVGNNALVLVHPDDREEAAIAMSRLIAGEHIRHTCRIMRRDGGEVWVEALARPAEPRGTFSAVIRDITERKEIQDLLEQAALHDPVTGLPNRRMIEDELSAASARAARSGRAPAALFLDVDRLKPVNDTYGHDAGDRVLRSVAARLTATVRRGDVAGRYGGDEFVVIAEELSDPRHEVDRLVARLDAVLSEPHNIGEVAIQVRASIGGAIWTEGMSPDALIVAADRAMYAEKERRRRSLPPRP